MAQKKELETREIHREFDQAKRDLWNEQKAFIKKFDKPYYEREKDFLDKEMAWQAVQRREEEVTRVGMAEAMALAKEVRWIISESRESILALSVMVKQPKRRIAPPHIRKLEDDCTRHLVGKTDDLLDYLWSKAVSGGWITPEIRDAIKLDHLLGLVSQAQDVDSYFPPATRQSATSLLDIWCHENWGAPGEGPRASPAYRGQAGPRASPAHGGQAPLQPRSGSSKGSRGGTQANASSQGKSLSPRFLNIR